MLSVHTGTGDIKLAAGRNFELTDNTSVVYSTGRTDGTNPLGIDGGDLLIRAGGDIIGAINEDQFITDWFLRDRAVTMALKLLPVTWEG